MKYLSIGTSPKTIKSDKIGEYLTAILYLQPNETICPMSVRAGCLAPCLNTAGRGTMATIQDARKRKTDAYLADPVAFVDQLAEDIRKAQRKADKAGKRLAVRLNGTSDIPFENVKGSAGKSLMVLFPDVQFYDYTKLPGRRVPSNYHLTVSYSGADPKYAAKVRRSRRNYSVVFRGELPAEFNGRPVVDGDQHDMTFIHPPGVVVGLKAKGKAKHDRSGFVVDTDIIGMGA